MAEDLVFKIDPEGNIHFVHSDAAMAIVSVFAESEITRASYVEPHPREQDRWLADMAPVGGPVLGEGCEGRQPHKQCDCDTCERVLLALTPFATHDAALAAERAWLREHRGL